MGGACTAVPASAKAIALNVAVTAPTSAGNCRLYPGSVIPQVSNVNFSAGQTRTNNAVVPLAGAFRAADFQKKNRSAGSRS